MTIVPALGRTAGRSRAADIARVVATWAATEPSVRRAYLYADPGRDGPDGGDLRIALLVTADPATRRAAGGGHFPALQLTWQRRRSGWQAALEQRLGAPVRLAPANRGLSIVRRALRASGVRLHPAPAPAALDEAA